MTAMHACFHTKAFTWKERGDRLHSPRAFLASWNGKHGGRKIPPLSLSPLSLSLSPLSAKWNGREKRKSAAVGPKFTDRVRNRESDIHPTLDSALDKGHSNLELGGGRILRSVIFSKTKWKRKAFGVGNSYFDCGAKR